MKFLKIIRRYLFTTVLLLLFASFAMGANAQINSSPVDIKGVKLGMTFQEASEILEEQGYILKEAPERYFSYTYNINGKIKKGSFGENVMTMLASKKDGNDVIHLSTAGHPERKNIVVVARAMKYPEQGTLPVWDQVKESVSEKFGEPHTKDEFDANRNINANPWLEYEWNSKGKKRSRGILKAVEKAAYYSVKQPECSLPERVIGKNFGKNFNYSYSELISEAYSQKYISYFSYLDNYVEITNEGNRTVARGYGPVGETRVAKIGSPSTDVLYTNGCRTVYFVRGNVDKTTKEVRSLLFVMMDHRTLKKDDRALTEWRKEQMKEINEDLERQIREKQKNAPKVDL